MSALLPQMDHLVHSFSFSLLSRHTPQKDCKCPSSAAIQLGKFILLSPFFLVPLLTLAGAYSRSLRHQTPSPQPAQSQPSTMPLVTFFEGLPSLPFHFAINTTTIIPNLSISHLEPTTGTSSAKPQQLNQLNTHIALMSFFMVFFWG